MLASRTSAFDSAAREIKCSKTCFMCSVSYIIFSHLFGDSSSEATRCMLFSFTFDDE